jgi:hypothetical protein
MVPDEVAVVYPAVPLLPWGSDQPEGTLMRSRPPSIAPSAVKVKIIVLPVLPALTVVGTTVQVPDPSAALTMTAGLVAIAVKVPLLLPLDRVVNVAVPALPAVAPEAPPPLP